MKLKTLSAISALAFLVVAGEGQAAPVNRQAPVSLFNGVEDIVFRCTTSTSFVDIPGLSRSFNQTAGAAEEVVAMMQGSFSLSLASPFDTAFVRLLIDGAVVGPGDQVPLTSVESFGATHGFNWQSKPLAAGAHTAKVQWRTDLGSQICVDARTLIVLHK